MDPSVAQIDPSKMVWSDSCFDKMRADLHQGVDLEHDRQLGHASPPSDCNILNLLCNPCSHACSSSKEYSLQSHREHQTDCTSKSI